MADWTTVTSSRKSGGGKGKDGGGRERMPAEGQKQRFTQVKVLSRPTGVVSPEGGRVATAAASSGRGRDVPSSSADASSYLSAVSKPTATPLHTRESGDKETASGTRSKPTATPLHTRESGDKETASGTRSKPTVTKSVALFDMVYKNKAVATISSSNSSSKASKADAAAAEIARKQIEARRSWLQKKQEERQRVQKKFTSLKKKLLLERMRRQMKLNINMVNSAGGMDAEKVGNADDVVVLVANFVAFDDLVDIDERAAIEADVGELVAPFGALVSVAFTCELVVPTAVNPNPNLEAVTAAGSSSSSAYYSSRCLAILTLGSSASAMATRHALHGLVLGGSALSVVAVCSQKSLAEHVQKDACADCAAELSTVALSGVLSDSCEERNSPAVDETVAAILAIDNLVFPEDVVDENEAAETLADVRSLLCAEEGSIRSVWIEKPPPAAAAAASAAAATAAAAAVSAHVDSADASRALPWVLIETSGASRAHQICCALEGVHVASRRLHTFICDYDSYLAGSASISAFASSSNGTFAVVLRSFLDCCYDDEEVAEVQRDLERQCTEAAGSKKWGVLFIDSNDGGGSVDVVIAVDSVGSAATIYEYFNGKNVGGAAVAVGILCIEDPSAFQQLLSRCPPAHAPPLPQQEWVAARSRLLCSSEGAYFSSSDGKMVWPDYRRDCSVNRVVVIVTNYLDSSDASCEVGRYDDELLELKSDLLALTRGDAASGAEGHVRRVTIYYGSSSGASSSGSDGLTACAGFASAEAAEAAMLAVDGMCVGGRRLHAAVTRTLCGAAAVAAVAALPTVVCAPVVVREPAPGDNHRSSDRPSAVGAPAVEPAAAAPEMNKYAAAKAAEKLPRRQLNEVYPRLPYVSPERDVHIEETLKALLKALSAFQARLKENDPLKFKQKMRLVSGLRQCTNGVRSGRALLVLLAPDTEENEALDGKIDALVSAAAERAVPTIVCLNRRRLGKAVDGKSATRQSAVAIYSADGAFEHYSKLLKELNIERG